MVRVGMKGRLLLFAAGLASLPCSCNARVSGGSRGAPVVSATVNDLVDGASDAKVAALKAKAASAVVRARGTAAEAATAEMTAEELEIQNTAKKPILERDLGTATSEAEAATKSADEAVASLEATRKVAATAVADAKKLAVEEVKSRLFKMYKQLDDWRNKVLRSPYDEAKAAGLKAAEPYNNMIRVMNGKIHEFQMVASGYLGSANSLEAGAEGLAGGAQGKMDAGDAIGANQDIMTAQAMQQRAKMEAGAATTLQGQATTMNKLISDYIAAGHMAAWQAEYQADPDQLPPPPANPNFAFTPPPPSMVQLGVNAGVSTDDAKERRKEADEYAEASKEFNEEKKLVEEGERELEPKLHAFVPAEAVATSFMKRSGMTNA